MRGLRTMMLALAGSLLAAGISHADTLLVDRVERDAAAAVPARGLDQSQVESQYGAPTEKHGPVGKPPISRWVYPGFTVYFEYSHVIHAVVNKSSALEKGPKTATQPSH